MLAGVEWLSLQRLKAYNSIESKQSSSSFCLNVIWRYSLYFQTVVPFSKKFSGLTYTCEMKGVCHGFTVIDARAEHFVRDSIDVLNSMTGRESYYKMTSRHCHVLSPIPWDEQDHFQYPGSYTLNFLASFCHLLEAGCFTEYPFSIGQLKANADVSPREREKLKKIHFGVKCLKSSITTHCQQDREDEPKWCTIVLNNLWF